MSREIEHAALEARVTELEIRYTHQEALSETLSEVIREQHAVIDALRRRIERLEAAAEPTGEDESERMDR